MFSITVRATSPIKVYKKYASSWTKSMLVGSDECKQFFDRSNFSTRGYGNAVMGTGKHDSEQFLDTFLQQSIYAKVALFESRNLQKQGDALYVVGKLDLAKEKYQQSHDIKSAVLEAAQPTASSRRQKTMSSRAA